MELNQTRLVLERARFLAKQARLVERDDIAQVRLGKQGDCVSHITKYILIVFYAEVEGSIRAIIKNALCESCDDNVANFLINSWGIKRIDTKNPERTLRYFGKDKARLFQDDVGDEVLTQYQNFINNRNTVAHDSQGTIETSWLEVQYIADIGESVLNAFQKAIKAEGDNGQATMEGTDP